MEDPLQEDLDTEAVVASVEMAEPFVYREEISGS
jgi:hypothetical protein